MTSNIRNRALAVFGAAALGITLFAPVAGAQLFTALSDQHTQHGVSQMWAGEGNDRRNQAARVDNPNRRTHVVAFLVYDRFRESSPGTSVAERFIGCTLRTVTPHGSLTLDNISPFSNVGSNDRLYFEAIAVPRSPVMIDGSPTRLADGLGVIVEYSGRDYLQKRAVRSLNPRLFNFPDTIVNPGTPGLDCICGELASENLPLDLFAEFGVSCPI